MKNVFTLLLACLFTVSIQAQSDLSFHVTDASSGLDLNGAVVDLDGTTMTTDASGMALFNVPDGSYNFTVTLDCYFTQSGSVTVAGTTLENVQLAAESTNSVFFFVGSPLTISGATVNMTGPNGYNETLTTGNPIGDVFPDVPFGEYNYTISLDCYETLSGTVTVECLGGGMGVSVFANPVEETDNDVFFFVGSPLTISGATVNMTGPNGYNETLTTGNPIGDVFPDVPFGEYNYTISLDCYETLSGTVTVECLGGGMGVSVFANPVEETDNDVFFFVGSPLTISGATVNMTGPNGYNETLTTGNPIGDVFPDVPFGEYNYTISLDCYETLSGTVTVECLGGGMGVSVFANPVEETDNDVFFFVGSPLTISGATVNMTGPNGYNETLTTGNPIGDVFPDVPFGEYNYTISLDCYETLSGTVTVECIGGGMGVSVFANPVEETDNDVFFFVGSPLPISGATVNMTGPNGYNETLTTGNPIGDVFPDVPFGEYNYTISLDCYETLSGTVTVECLGGGMGVSVFENPAEETDNDVFFFVGSPLPISGATVNMTGPNGYNETLTTGNPIGDVFPDVPFGEYNYTISLDCYETLSGAVTVECIGGGMGVSVFENPAEETDNDVFFFVGSPLPISGAEVHLTGPNGYDETLTTGNPSGDVFPDVPYGAYDYTITKDCYITLTGSVNVECIGGGMGVSVFENPSEETDNDVFFFVGSPLPISGAEVHLTGPNGYDETLTTGNPSGDVFPDVPYGAYDYTITKDCYTTITGSVNVECIGGGMGVSVFENPAEETDNDVFFFVGSPLPISGAEVHLTGPNGYDETLTTGNPSGDVFPDVPYGAYDYTITKDCYTTITGSVNVECIGGGMGVSVFENPEEVIIDTAVSVQDQTLIASQTGAEYQWIDCATNEPIDGATEMEFTPQESGSYAVIISMEGCSATSDCYEIQILSVGEFANPIMGMAPNPARDMVQIQLDGAQDTSIQLYDLQGRLVLQQHSSVSDVSLNVSGLANGTYLVVVERMGKRYVRKLIKH